MTKRVPLAHAHLGGISLVVSPSHSAQTAQSAHSAQQLQAKLQVQLQSAQLQAQLQAAQQQLALQQAQIAHATNKLASLGISSPLSSHTLSPSHTVVKPVTRSSHQWASAGTLIIDEVYHRRNRTSCQAILLGFNPNRGCWELFYGKRDTSDSSPHDTARRETREESSNMFRLTSPVYDENCKASSSNGKHHVYVVRVIAPSGGIQSSVFQKNQQILKSNGAPPEWRELTHITRIDISDAIGSGIMHTRGNFTMPDVYGNNITIFSRDVEFIADALCSGLHAKGNVHQLSCVRSWDDSRKGGRHMFLNGTTVYQT